MYKETQCFVWHILVNLLSPPCPSRHAEVQGVRGRNAASPCVLLKRGSSTCTAVQDRVAWMALQLTDASSSLKKSQIAGVHPVLDARLAAPDEAYPWNDMSQVGLEANLCPLGSHDRIVPEEANIHLRWICTHFCSQWPSNGGKEEPIFVTYKRVLFFGGCHSEGGEKTRRKKRLVCVQADWILSTTRAALRRRTRRRRTRPSLWEGSKKKGGGGTLWSRNGRELKKGGKEEMEQPLMLGGSKNRHYLKALLWPDCGLCVEVRSHGS